jgi:hypothetical protein
MDRAYQKSEDSFLRAKRGEPTVEPARLGPDNRVRQKDRPRKLRVFKPVMELRQAHEAISKLNTQEFFAKLLGGGIEEAMWMAFMTGQRPRIDEQGTLVRDSEGRVIMEDIELNPISWNAFKRAVEYKRGMPLGTIEDDTKKGAKMVQIITIGANPQLFRSQAEAQGLLGIRKSPSQNETDTKLIEEKV